MKKLTVIVVAALVAILVAAAPARADLFPRVPFNFTPTDGGRIVGGEDAPAAWGPILDTAFQIGDEERAVLHTSNVNFDDTLGSQQVTDGGQVGLIYDRQLVDIEILAADSIRLYYGPANRNPDPSATGNDGGVFKLFEDTSPESGLANYFNTTVTGTGASPWDWVENSGTADTFPNVNDPGDSGTSLWLGGYFQQLGTAPNGAPYFGRENLNPTNNTANFEPNNLVVTGGLAVTRGYLNTGQTVALRANTSGPGNANYDGSEVDDGNWQVEASDPWTLDIVTGVSTIRIGNQVFTVNPDDTNQLQMTGASSLYAPEPGMASLLGIGLLGLLLSGRRRKDS